MKTLTVLFILGLVKSSQAGFFIEKNLYLENSLAVGRGSTVQIARNDALQAIPKGFKEDSNHNSPAYQCANSNLAWTEESECNGNEIQMVIPLVKIK